MTLLKFEDSCAPFLGCSCHCAGGDAGSIVAGDAPVAGGYVVAIVCVLRRQKWVGSCLQLMCPARNAKARQRYACPYGEKEVCLRMRVISLAEEHTKKETLMKTL